jgi:hypothetical protein
MEEEPQFRRFVHEISREQLFHVRRTTDHAGLRSSACHAVWTAS